MKARIVQTISAFSGGQLDLGIVSTEVDPIVKTDSGVEIFKVFC